MRMHHRCLAEVAFGGRLLGSEGGQLVCGEPVCGPCSAKFGNEGVTRCQRHSGSTSDSETTLEEKRSAVKSRNGLAQRHKHRSYDSTPDDESNVEPTKAAVKPTIAAAKPNNGVVTIAKAGRCKRLSSSLLLADESTNKAPIATNKAGPSGKAEGKVRSPEYSSKDLLILAQSYIRVSENAIDGTAKKSSTFWEEVAVTFNKLKQSQVTPVKEGEVS
jgi:hypothetical protein